jgi:hypothetical protein
VAETAADFRRRYGAWLDAVAAGARADLVAEARLVSVEGSARPWTDTGIDLGEGEQISVLAGGRLVLSEELGLRFRPNLYLWRRIGEKGPIFKAPRDTATHRAAAPGRLYLAVAPGHWTTREGDWEGSDGEHAGLPGAFHALLIRWKVDPLEGLRALRGELPDDPLVAAEIARLEAPPAATPRGWEYLWFLGEGEIFSEVAGERPAIRARFDDDVAILRRPAALDLTPDTRLQWRWKVDRLPGTRAEDQFHAHDYVSIAVEFDNGQDLTWYWSAALPEETSFRCPLPWWDRHETHLVVRSGPAGLGTWQAEERNVYADYRAAVGEPPARIAAVWLIAVSVMAHGLGVAEFADIALASGGERLPVC